MELLSNNFYFFFYIIFIYTVRNHGIEVKNRKNHQISLCTASVVSPKTAQRNEGLLMDTHLEEDDKHLSQVLNKELQQSFLHRGFDLPLQGSVPENVANLPCSTL